MLKLRKELCTKLMDAAVANGAELRIGTVEGLNEASTEEGGTERTIDSVVVDGEAVLQGVRLHDGTVGSARPDWFDIPVPMTGIKSTSIVFKAKEGEEVEPFALFAARTTTSYPPRGLSPQLG